MIKDLSLYFQSGCPCVAIQTYEEKRAMDEILQMAKTYTGKRNIDVKVFAASITMGIVQILDKPNSIYEVKAPGNNGFEPHKILKFCMENASKDSDEWIVIYDIHSFLKVPLMIRLFKDMCEKLRKTDRRVILLSAYFDIPKEIKHELVLMDLSLPDKEELREPYEKGKIAIESAVKRSENGIKMSDLNLPETESEVDALLEAARGMTLLEAENAYSIAFKKSKNCSIDPRIVMEIKAQTVKKSGILELYPTVEGFNMVGGYEKLIKWLQISKKAFSKEAREYGLPVPKGVLLLGVQGCGKSLISKAVAMEWGFPLLRLDAGKLFGGVIGETESNTREVIKLAEAVSPCVLFIDEIDKGLATPSGQVLSGGEVTRHVIGTFCTWLQEKTEPVFIIATANSFETMPPELLRKGRWDELWFMDLPSPGERKNIAKVIISKYKRDPKKFDLNLITSKTNGFSGAEIENSFIEAMKITFSENGRQITSQDYLNAISKTTPISRTMEDEIKKLRDWAKGRARWASDEIISSATSFDTDNEVRSMKIDKPNETDEAN